MGKVFKLIFLVTIVSGCAIGNKHSYHQIDMKFNPKGITRLSVATFDQRDYIKNGNKEPDFVGLQRGGYGNTFDVTTVSGKSLAEDMTTSIVQSLKSHGVDAIPVIVTHELPIKKVTLELPSKNKTSRSLLLVLKEWKSDTMQRTALIYDVTMLILDEEGDVLIAKSLKGRDNLGGSFLNPTGHAKEVIPLAFKDKLESLLSNKSILKALE